MLKLNKIFFYKYCFFSVVENYDILDFGLINYVRNEREDHGIREKIIACKFEEESKWIFQRADVRVCLSPEQWKWRCENLMHNFFSRDGKDSGIITFPETNFTAQGKPWQNVMSTLKKWCENSNSDNGKQADDATGIIIRNYDLKNHLDFCNVTYDAKKNCLPFLLKYAEGKCKFNENDQRFLVFNPSENIILVIRMVDTQKSGELKNEAHLCIDEVNVVCLLLKDELKDSGVIVTGLVSCSGENTHSQSCTHCGNFIVSRSIFNSVEEFVAFWKSFKENILAQLGKYLKTRGKNDTTTVFQAVGGKILGYLAHLQFLTLEEPVLPVIENNPSGNILQAELLLDRYQMEIAYSDEKRILLRGNYGTGKTVIALKKLELLCKCLKEKDVIYYINFARKSRLDCMIKQKFKTNEKVRVLRGGSSLSHLIKNKILPKEEKNDNKNIHVMVDEYNSQFLTSEESKELYQIFAEKEQFKNSTLFIALQPIKIDRINYFTVAGRRQKNLHEQHAFWPLKKIMTEYQLKYVMRTTAQINTLTEITQHYLSKQSNQYIQSHQSNEISSSHSKINKMKSESSPESPRKFIRLSKNSSPISNPPSNITSDNPCELISGEINRESSYHKSASIVSSSSSIASVASSSSATSQLLASAIIDIDEYYKSASAPIKKGVENLSASVTKYSYTCDSEIGHGIEGPVPLLIEFNKSYGYKQLLTLIAFFLKDIIDIKSKRIAILHFESTNASWLYELLQLESCFKDLALTDDVERFLTDTNDNMVLVNSYDIVKGLEFSEVLLILEKNEHHQKQYIPEAITRCRSHLFVLVRPPWKKNNQRSTVKDLVDHWKKINAIKILKGEKSILKLLTLGFCSDKSCKKLRTKSSSCPGRADSSEILSFYGVHKHTKWYKDLVQEIEKIVPILKLDDETKKEEARAL